jgi:glycosyltransferase involved in cell wall biosynthesis
MILGIDGRLANAKRPAGAGHYCREVLRALGEMDAGLWLRVYLDDEPVPELPVRRDRIRMLPRGPLWTHRILANELRSHPPDVFFSPLAQVPWRCPCPSLVTVLDLAAWSHPSFFPWRKRLTMKIQARHAIGAAGHLVGISEATATDLAQRFRLDPARITVVPLGCGERFFNPAPAEPGTILSTLPESYVLYLGQVQPRKNLLRLIAAFERVLKAHPDLPHHLVLAGGLGWQNEAIYRVASHSAVADRIQFLDYVPDAQVPTILAGADVLALVSLWEGFGLPALEAMAAGTAVLTSNCSSLPEVVGDAGVLVDPENEVAIADGLARLLLDDGLRAQCEQRGRERARGFTWERTARAILDAAQLSRRALKPTS